jgi:hypothetical protein
VTTIRLGVRPFRVEVPDEALAKLRRSVVASSWPDGDTDADRSQGVQFATIQQFARNSSTEHGWRKVRISFPMTCGAVGAAIDPVSQPR